MKYNIAFTLFTLFFFAQNSIAAIKVEDERSKIRNNFPKVEEVLSFLQNEIRYNVIDGSYGVAKKRDGFYLTVNRYLVDNRTEVVHEEKIWSLDAGFKYFDIPKEYLDFKHSVREIPRELINVYNRREMFDFMLLFGYPEWTKDVQEILSNYKDLSGEDLEILARSYSNEAINYIHPNMFGNNFEFSRSFKLSNYEQIPADQLEDAIKLANTSLEIWERIRKEYPEYRPKVVNNLALKIGHEYMFYYHSLMSVKEPKKAKKFLDKAWYSPAYVAYATNLLESCPENAILLTNGDSDTYPLLYAQEKLKIRKDVIVLNRSLMNAGWYLTMNKEVHKLKTTAENFHYVVTNFTGYFPDKKQAESVPFQQWMTKKMSESGMTRNDGEVELIPQRFTFQYKGENMETKLEPSIFYMSDLTLLDYMQNNPERTVMMTNAQSVVNLGLWDRLVIRGYLMEVVPGIGASPKWDEKTMLMAEENISALSTSYLSALNDVGPGLVNMLGYSIMNIYKAEQKRAKSMFNDLFKSIPTSDIAELENTEYINIFASLSADLDRSLSEDLKRKMEPRVFVILDEISALSKNMDQDITNLELFFFIYSDSAPQYWGAPSKPSELDLKILNAIQSKVETLLNYEIVQRRSWTHLRLNDLNKRIQEVLQQ